MAKKSEPQGIPSEPVPASEHRALAENQPTEPEQGLTMAQLETTAQLGTTARSRRNRLIAAAVVGALVIAGGSAAVTAYALTGSSGPDAAGAMPGMGGSSSPGAGLGTGQSTPQAAGPVVDTAGFPTGGVGIFTDTCLRTKTAPNDPILMPGMTGHSMQHDFFGNTGTTASSVTTQLVGGSTSCTTSADASAYWTPVVSQNGSALTPKSTLIYWRAPSGAQSSVKTVPAGLTMIAGNEAADSPQGKQTIGWTCSGVAQIKLADSPQDCAAGTYLRLVITFPNCWDGHTLDGAKQTNVVAMTKNSCPSSHPIQIPQLVMHLNYPTSSAEGLTLSIGPTTQGSITTEHADFMNGWNEPVLTADVNACVTTGTRCGPVKGAEATPKGGKAN